MSGKDHEIKSKTEYISETNSGSTGMETNYPDQEPGGQETEGQLFEDQVTGKLVLEDQKTEEQVPEGQQSKEQAPDTQEAESSKTGPKWTEEQQEAIVARDCNLLVAAAAGAGKTAVLVERIIQRITDKKNPVDIDRILVVTFTNAAATEMRERISDAISKELDKNPENSDIRRQLNLLGKSAITTIHSFCRDVIKSHIQDIDLDPSFRVADETECVLMRLEAMTEMFEDLYEEKQQDFMELLESYGSSRNDQAIQDMVMDLYFFIQSDPWPDRWLDKMACAMDIPEGVDFSSTPWGSVIIDTMKLEITGLYNALSRAVAVLKYAEGLEKYIPVFEEDLASISDLLKTVEGIPSPSSPEDMAVDIDYWNRLYESLHSIEFSRLPIASKNADKEKQQYVKDLRDGVKNTIKRFKQKLMNAESENIIKDIKALYPLMLCLVRLVREFTQRYSEKKRKRVVLDFNDLEHLCLEILTTDSDGVQKPTKTAFEYRTRFEEIMVDEYQDSNMVQEMIITTISRQEQEKPNVFMVGDVKQSIYRFRQAKPELFMEKYNTYSPEKSSLYRKILLYKNFRSRKEIVDAVNFIFAQIMSVRAGELDYTNKEALNAGADYPENPYPQIVVGGPAELHLIQTVKDDSNNETEDLPGQNGEEPDELENENDETENLDNIQCEARLAAIRILELMKLDSKGQSFHVFDKKKKEYRKLEYRDIVILLRTTKNWSDVFVDELSAMGIPVFADTGTGFFKTTEVQVVLSLLQIIDNPLQDIPLLSVLRSPVFEFTTDELSCIRIAERNASLFEALNLLAQRALDEKESEAILLAAQKAADFIEKLASWRDISSYMTTDQLIWYLYQETGYYSMVGAMPEGEQRQANLRILYDRARQFEETSYKGLFNFINFVDKLKTSRGDMGSAKILSENDNVVRIMSIHKSKGLEFPVVILAGCGKRFNLMDMNKSILLHQELGFGPDVVDHRKRIAWPSAAKLGIREKIKTETLSEEMRILYVAMTRAREKLIITGSVRNVEKSLTRWCFTASSNEEKLSDIDILNANNFLDWIGPALIRHKGNSMDSATALISNREDLIDTALKTKKEELIDLSLMSNKEGSMDSVLMSNKEDSIAPTLISDEECNCKRKSTLRDFALHSAEFNFKLIESPSKWSFRMWTKDDVSSEKIADSSVKIDFLQWLDSLSTIPQETGSYGTKYTNEINRRLIWSYPYKVSSKIPAKVTVTELKRRFDKELIGEADRLPVSIPTLIKKPLFLEEKKGINAAEAGTALHFVMQHLDFKNLDIKAQITKMVEKDLLTKAQADSVKTDKIKLFLESDIGKRILAAKVVRREVPFNLEIPCCELYNEMDTSLYENETFLLQGIIDCFFEEPDGLVLLDYKTDYVPNGGTDSIKERYRIQIDYYTRALGLLEDKKVKGKYIYLFYNNEILEY
jgi:ATP-dependent helicase/nuclease subunit A